MNSAEKKVIHIAVALFVIQEFYADIFITGFQMYFLN